MTKQVSFQENEIVEVLKHLNGIVVSLDKLTSAHIDLSPELWRTAVFEYFMSSEALKALPNCRTILSRPFSTEIGPDNMDDLERALQHSEYWSFREFVNQHGRK